MEPLLFLLVPVGVMGIVTLLSWLGGRRLKKRPIPPMSDPERWLREQRRKEMHEWDREFLRLGGGNSTHLQLQHLRRNATQDEVRYLQRVAKKSGAYEGPIDGIPGEGLIVALRKVRNREELWGDVVEERSANGDVVARFYEDPKDPRRWV